jgi:hypothetical protein
MKRLILSIQNFFRSSSKHHTIQTISGKETVVNDSEPNISSNSRVVLSSNEHTTDYLSNKVNRVAVGGSSYRKILISFIINEPRAKNGFTAVELYNWMGRTLPMSAISKTLYRMKLCGEVISEVKEDDGRIRIWKIASLK